MDEVITLEVRRRDPLSREGATVDVFQVPCTQRHSIYTLLNYVYAHLDPTLGFRHYTCNRGMCNTCRVRLNGKVVKACATTVNPGAHLVLEAYNNRVIRDLATVIEGSPRPPDG